MPLDAQLRPVKLMGVTPIQRAILLAGKLLVIMQHPENMATDLQIGHPRTIMRSLRYAKIHRLR